MNKEIVKDIIYIGVDDKGIDLFESQYVVPNGISYNSYLIRDDKNVVMDTVDRRATDEWYENLQEALQGESVDYLVVSHMEPDHAYNIQKLCDAYPDMKIVSNQKVFSFLPQFFEIENLEERKVVVGEGDTFCSGKHTFQFVMAPMVHWPEVMMTYEVTNQILFSADAFGKFGALDTKEDWDCEARRYYFNIVGKYGVQVQAVLKKAKSLPIKTICPLHGPILTKDLGHYLEKYDIWSRYEPENEGVTIAYASIHGNTKEVAEEFAHLLKEAGVQKVSLFDLARDDLAEAIEDAFRYDKLVLAAASYNADVFPPMHNFLHQLQGKNYQKRKIAIIENGTWAPSAAKKMLEIVENMKEVTVCEKIVTIRSRMNEKNKEEMKELVEELLK